MHTLVMHAGQHNRRQSTARHCGVNAATSAVPNLGAQWTQTERSFDDDATHAR